MKQSSTKGYASCKCLSQYSKENRKKFSMHRKYIFNSLSIDNFSFLVIQSRK